MPAVDRGQRRQLGAGAVEQVRRRQDLQSREAAELGLVDAGASGGGIGAALMDWALAEARTFGADEIQLSVWSGNEGAQRFYQRYGFEKVADIDFWVGQQRDDEFLFARML